MDQVVGQDLVVSMLKRAAEHDHFSSAYLFEGPSGVGKKRTTIRFAVHVLAKNNPGVERRILAGSHPDVRVFAPREEGQHNLPVEFVREEVLRVARYAPFEAERAFLIFPDADVSLPETHPESANALLKTLEEPRSRVHFILTSAQPERLLPTVRSRCQRVRFSRLAPSVVSEILHRHQIQEPTLSMAVALSEGRADRALELADKDAAQAWMDLAFEMDAVTTEKRAGKLADVAEKVARSPHLQHILEMLTTVYRDIACAALGKPIVLSTHKDRIHQRARALGPLRSSARGLLLTEFKEALQRNANAEIAMDDLLCRLSAI